MSLVVGLDEIGPGSAARFGGKATALAALHRAGVRVPRTVCLTTDAYELFVDAASLRGVLHQELGRKRFADMRWEELWDAALRIRNRFLRAPVPAPVAVAIDERLASVLTEGVFVVRSSAAGEDAPGASHAGLHDSVVGVRGRSAILDAVRRVWASLWTDRALLYRRELGIDPDTSSMAVVIQELVLGEVSGVAFGVHPAEPESAVVEAVYGLNQGLVDGTIEPDRWEVERGTGRVVRRVAPDARRRLVVRGSDLVVEPVPAPHAAQPPLGDVEVASVVAAVRAAGELFDRPQDIEWTLTPDGLVLLQSRPITTAPTSPGDRRAWYLGLTRSVDTIRRLCDTVERDLLPAMDREADRIAARDPTSLDPDALADEIEHRRAAHDRWVDTYWREFIPLAHGIRLFGQFYNDVVRPDDPFEFMELLAATPLLSVRRNRSLEELATTVRRTPSLRERLELGERGDPEFEERLDGFLREHGGAAFAARKCFADRARLVRLVLALADAERVAEPARTVDPDALRGTFLARVEPERRSLAQELLELGRASYRLRDDDNLHLARLESLVLDAVEEGRRRVAPEAGAAPAAVDEVVRALRHPNLVVEPAAVGAARAGEPGFRARPRQLVGQPAGPGIATGAARVVTGPDDLFQFRSGEVLVCDAVDPNMTFVVPLACAVVERRGGMLVHGAIIAREYGLPCVTGVPDAAASIATGDQLTVDGYLGIVTVASP